jgi:hypothetical protein
MKLHYSTRLTRIISLTNQSDESVVHIHLWWIHVFLSRVSRYRGEIHNMGAHQAGARITTTQSKAEENHYKLHHRWETDECSPDVCVRVSRCLKSIWARSRIEVSLKVIQSSVL